MNFFQKCLHIVFCVTSLSIIAVGCSSDGSHGTNKDSVHQTIRVSLAGNAYQTSGESGDGISREGITEWEDKSSRFSIFVKFDQKATVKISLGASVDVGESTLEVHHKENVYPVTIGQESPATVEVATVNISEAGYARFDIKGLKKESEYFGQVTDLVLDVPQNVELTYVKDNKKNRFYWGRRGPSVHLGYMVPKDKDFEWFYNEITVPKGEDPVGSYFMANGFGEGYFGIQVNSKQERRVLFSVWSPHKTDNPDDIPIDQRIQVLKKGEGVYTGKFGNEGSGGQSYWVYPWEAGRTYRFLNGARPDGKGNTIYTAYFYLPDEQEWKLIAQFKRPKTDSWYTRPHSFLENFVDTNGYLGRRAQYHDQWLRDKDGQWYEVTEARFTGDDIAQREYRVDYAGGVEKGAFFLQNGGFFDKKVPLNTKFSLPGGEQAPSITFSNLP